LLKAGSIQLRPGFMLFLLLTINHIYLFIAPYTANSMLNIYISNNENQPMGLTFGEVAALLYFVPRLIEVIAFAILVSGLYRMWQLKPASSNL
jgi:hypothetical protein